MIESIFITESLIKRLYIILFVQCADLIVWFSFQFYTDCHLCVFSAGETSRNA